MKRISKYIPLMCLTLIVITELCTKTKFDDVFLTMFVGMFIFPWGEWFD